ncbi:MAG: GPGG-motif small membrane protein [Acidimicrobiia bacterium]
MSPPRDWASRVRSPSPSAQRGGQRHMEFVLWIIAVVLVVAGIVALVRGAVAYGIVLIIVGLLVGPGGVSVFT